jgi:hypothetical protein
MYAPAFILNFVQYTGEITYTPVTATTPAGYYWGINVTDATYGSKTTVIPTSTAGMVDTGTTGRVLPLNYMHTFLTYL